MSVLFSVITQLIGKWACTARILYWKPLVTPGNEKKGEIISFRWTFEALKFRIWMEIDETFIFWINQQSQMVKIEIQM